jgi:hypothetical protein
VAEPIQSDALTPLRCRKCGEEFQRTILRLGILRELTRLNKFGEGRSGLGKQLASEESRRVL